MNNSARTLVGGGILSALLATTALSLPTLAHAQAPAPAADESISTLQELVVTARRKDERLQDVPVAVVVLTDEALDEQGVRNPNDLSRVAPGLSIQNTAANRVDTTYSVRGQGSTFGSNTPGVVAYFAEVPDFGTAIYDLEGIQVLKGPQGTLFGRNTTGGAILFTPRKPSEEFNGYVLGRMGNYHRVDGEFGFGGPLFTDKVMFRVAGQSLQRDGYTRYLADGAQLDDENRQSFRAQITVKPFENFTNTTLYQNASINENGSGAILGAVNLSPSNASVFTRMQADLAAQQVLGIRVAQGNFLPHYVVRKSDGWINTTTLTLNDMLTLKNIYSDRRFHGGQSYDLDSTNVTLLHVTNPSLADAKLQTEEFQGQLSLGPVSGVLGYYSEKSSSPSQVGFRIQQFNFGVVSDIQVIGRSESETQAFYGQFDWKVTEQLTLTAGARRSEVDTTSGPQITQFVLPAPFAPLTIASSAAAMSTFKSTTWNVAANYKLTPELNVYGTVRKGYKPGGFNGTVINPADRPYAPEEVTDYEVGIKGQRNFGDWQTRFAADAFYDDYTNIQRFVNLNTVPAQTIVRNAAAGSIMGVDLDLTVVPNDLFSVSLNYSYLQAEYDRYVDPVLGDLSASKFPNSPEHQLTLTPRVTIPVPEELGQLTALATIYYQSSLATDPANVPNGNAAVAASALGAQVDGYTRVDLRADLRNIYGSGASVAAYVQNVLDEEYVVGTNNQLNAATGTVGRLYGAPRFFGVEVRYEFGN